MEEINDIGYPEYYTNDTVYPNSLEKGNVLDDSYLIPNSIDGIYKETISALKTKSRLLAAGGLRATIEATCNHLEIKKDSLEKRIDLLHKNGHLSLNEAKRLHSIRFLGNDALHEIEAPKEEQLYILFDIVNHLLSNLFIADKKIKGKVDTVIDSYDEFLKVIRNKIKEENINEKFTITQLLGKSKRLINSTNLKALDEKFRDEIKNEKHNWIELDNEEFVVKKVPEFVFSI